MAAANYSVKMKKPPSMLPPRRLRPSAPPPPTAKMIPVTELTNATCRWPFNSGRNHPEFLFCGDPTADFDGGVPYCPAHMALAHDR